MPRMKTTAVTLALVVGLLIAMAPAQEPSQTPDTFGLPAEETVTGKKPPQPRTQEEYEAAQKLNNVSLSPDRMIALAEEFVQKFPDSDYKGFAYRTAMEGYRQKNNFPKMHEFGEKALEEDPDDAVVLVRLATAIPMRTRPTDLNKKEKLKQAEEYARRALAAIPKMLKPDPEALDAEWESVQNDLRGSSYAALGHVAYLRDQYPASADFFKKAIELKANKDAVVHLLLGLTYRAMNKLELARDALKQTVELETDSMVGNLAAQHLQRVEKLLEKQQQQ